MKCSFILGKVHSLRKRDFAGVIKDFEIRSSWINWMALKSKGSALIRTADTVKEAMWRRNKTFVGTSQRMPGAPRI